MIPFPIPWKFVLIGLLILGVVIGVKTAFASYNQAIADAEFYKGEQEKALQIAEGNAVALQTLRGELARMEALLTTNRQEREEIEVKSNEEIARWKRRAANLAKSDDCVNAPHPPNLFDQLRNDPKDDNPPNRDSKAMSTHLTADPRICSVIFRDCMVGFSDVYIPVTFRY